MSFSPYIYDFQPFQGTVRWHYDRVLLDRWCTEATSALRKYPGRTDVAEQADAFVATSTLQCLSFFTQRSWMVRRHLRRLPYVRTGKPHILFDFTDDPRPLIDRSALRAHGDRFLICKSALHTSTYRPEVHVPIPQFPRYRFTRPVSDSGDRTLLASFTGHLRPQHTGLRKKLLELNDHPRFVIQSGEVTESTIQIQPNGELCEADRASPDSYTGLLFRSKYALLPRGHGAALSYRMIECMNAGCIPVILSDGYVLPFEHEIDYSACSIRVPESEVSSLPEILQEHEPEAPVMQNHVLACYNNYFSSTEKIIHTTLDQCARLLQTRSGI